MSGIGPISDAHLPMVSAAEGKSGWPWIPAPAPSLRGDPPKSWPRISVITPSYNQERFIEETLRSVLLQGYPNLEYIVIDGGSDHATIAAIETYSPWLSYFCSEPDHGQSDAINKGLRRATGDLLVWLNSDDVFMPGALEMVARAASDVSDPLVIAGNSEYRDELGNSPLYVVDRLPSTVPDLFDFCRGRYFAQPSTFFTRAAFERGGALNESLHYAMDLDLWFRLLQCSRIVHVNAQLSWMRQHGDAKTSRDTLIALDEVEKLFSVYAGLVPPRTHAEARMSLRTNRAKVWIEKGLRAVRQGDNKAAIAAAVHAVGSAKHVIFSRQWLGLAARIALQPSFVAAR